MSFFGIKLQGQELAKRYQRLGYKTNPFPKQGQVDGDTYVRRAELSELEQDLARFLGGGERGSVWAIQGAIGYGKTNFLKAVEREIQKGLADGTLSATACRFVPSLALTPRRIIDEMLQGIGETAIVALIRHPSTPTVAAHFRTTDYGRFWESARQAAVPVEKSAQFLVRWLSGQQTYKAEREQYGVTARERLPPAVAFPYLRELLDMFDTTGLLKRIVLLLDEFEDLEQLPKAGRTEYVQVLKTLLNAFNWRGLYVVIAGQPAAFTTIGESYPSLASRWRPVVLQPVGNTDAAVELATPYKGAARLDPSRGADDLVPTPADIKAAYIRLYEKTRHVSQRRLLTSLHEWVEEKANEKERE